MKPNKTWITWALLSVLLGAYPQVLGIYYINLFVNFAVFAVFTVSFNLLLGYTGLFSFGHAMFFGVGGYGAALALKHISGLPLLGALGFGLLAAIVLALLLCPLVVRVSGTAFAMLHLAFGQLLYILALKLRNLTGGEDGIGGFPMPPLRIPGILSIPLDNPTNFFYFSLIILGLSLWLMWFFTQTPFGQIQIGIRDNPRRIDYLGFKVAQSKAVIYVVAGAFAGVAGAIYALSQNLISADSGLSILISFAPISNAVVGGIGSFLGPLMGTAVLQVLQELSTRYTERVELVEGLILIGVILFAPKGLTGIVDHLKQRWFPSQAQAKDSENAL